jgi:hypothetical protein
LILGSDSFLVEMGYTYIGFLVTGLGIYEILGISIEVSDARGILGAGFLVREITSVARYYWFTARYDCVGAGTFEMRASTILFGYMYCQCHMLELRALPSSHRWRSPARAKPTR